MNTKRRDFIAAVIICLAPFIYFFAATSGQVVLSPDDAMVFYLPMRVAVARTVLDGEFPLWNPYMFGGMPLFANIQSGVLFPLNWGFLFLAPQWAMNLTMLAAYSLAGLGAYLFARRAGANIVGAFVTGFVWMFCGFMIAPLGHTTSIHAASLTGWILWAVESYAQTGRRGRAALIAVFIALQVFAGHPQTLVYSSSLVGAYTLVMALAKRPARRFYFYSLAMICVGAGLAAVQLIPTAELAHYSFRAAIDYEFFSSFSMPPSFLLNFFAPFRAGGGDGRFFQIHYTGANFYAEYIGYVGLMTLALAFTAITMKRDAQTLFWTCAALVSLLLALGRFAPFEINRFIYYVPGLNLFRVPARHLMETDFALAVLAGRGLTSLCASANGNGAKKFALVSFSVFVVTLLVVFDSARYFSTIVGSGNFQTWRLPEVWCPVLFAVAGGLAALFLLLRKSIGGAVALILFLIICDLSLWGHFSGWRVSCPPRDGELWNELPLTYFLQHNLAHESHGGAEPIRILSLPAPLNGEAQLQTEATLLALQPDFYMLHGIENAAGYDAFGLKRFSAFADDMKEWGELARPLQSLTSGREFDLLDVRYLIAKKTSDNVLLTRDESLAEDMIAEHWQSAAQFDDLAVYQNRHATARAWLATNTLVLPEGETLNAVRTGKFTDESSWDAARMALLDAPLENYDVIHRVDENPPTRAAVTRYAANRIEVKTDCDVSSILILGENFYPGWRVRVDDQEQKILRVNYNLRGVALPAGAHNVSFAYQPKSFISGSIISAISLLVLLVWWRLRIAFKPRRA
jgi:hypothetical protein